VEESSVAEVRGKLGVVLVHNSLPWICDAGQSTQGLGRSSVGLDSSRFYPDGLVVLSGDDLLCSELGVTPNSLT
jgi:hypothetical protein